MIPEQLDNQRQLFFPGRVASLENLTKKGTTNLAVGAALAFDPEVALLPEDVPRGERAKLAHAEPSVEQAPDDEPVNRCLAGVGEMVRFLDGERFSHVLIWYVSSPKSVRARGWVT